MKHKHTNKSQSILNDQTELRHLIQFNNRIDTLFKERWIGIQEIDMFTHFCFGENLQDLIEI